MRILVATDRIGALSSRQAGGVIGSGWLPGADVSMLPIGESGSGFVAAFADLAGVATSSQVINGIIVTTGRGPDTGLVQVLGSGPGVGIPYQQSSRPIGEAIAALAGNHGIGRIVVDLAGLWVHDAGAGMLTALGAVGDRRLDQGVDGLDGLSELDLAPARALLGEIKLIGVVPAAQRDVPLVGLRGITARAGRETNVEPDRMLRTDAALEAFARLASQHPRCCVRGGGMRWARFRSARPRRSAEHRAGTHSRLGGWAGRTPRRRPRGHGLLGFRLRQSRRRGRRRNGRGRSRCAESVHRHRWRGAHRVT